MKQIQLDHVERLSRGQRSGINAGSRSVGHYLRPFERAHYERALQKGYMDITEKDRANLWHIWEKASLAQNISFLILIKHTASGDGTIYQDNNECETLPLKAAKEKIQKLAQKSNLKIKTQVNKSDTL